MPLRCLVALRHWLDNSSMLCVILNRVVLTVRNTLFISFLLHFLRVFIRGDMRLRWRGLVSWLHRAQVLIPWNFDDLGLPRLDVLSVAFECDKDDGEVVKGTVSCSSVKDFIGN